MLSLLLSLQAAWPCAGLITSNIEAIAISDTQEVILEQTETGTRTRYRISYDGDADHFGWLIVVHGEVGEGDVTEADASAFERLRDLTQPLYEELASGSGSGCRRGCGESMNLKGDAAAGGMNEFSIDTGSGIEVVAEGYAGPFHYQVLDASEPDALETWLEDNDFDLGGTATTLGNYVEEGGYSFVAVDLTPDQAVTPPEGRTLPALSIESDSDTLHFPARMAVTGMAEEIRTTIWLLGDQEAHIVSGWESEPVGEVDIDGTPEETYDATLRELAARAIPTYAQVFSSADTDGVWITRLDTLAYRFVHAKDPHFEFMENSRENRMVIVNRPSRGEAASWLLLPLLGMGWARRRHE